LRNPPLVQKFVDANSQLWVKEYFIFIFIHFKNNFLTKKKKKKKKKKSRNVSQQQSNAELESLIEDFQPFGGYINIKGGSIGVSLLLRRKKRKKVDFSIKFTKLI